MTTGAEPTFLDTNILVYASIPASPFHRAAVQALGSLEAQSAPLWVSRQVFREYLATLLRPQVGIAIADLAAAIRAFEQRYHVAEESALVTAQLVALLEEGQTRQVHDTNIVATMLTYGIPRLLTNNPADFAPFATRITIIPLG